MRRLFSKGVARSGLAPPRQSWAGRRGGGAAGSGEQRRLLPSALAALEPDWAPAPARAAPAGPQGSLVPCGTQGRTGLCTESAGSHEGLRSRRRSYAGSGATVAHPNAQPSGLAQPRPPAPGRCRSLEGASPAPGAPPPPAQRSRPQSGCHCRLTPGAEDPAPPAAPASEGATDRMQEGPLNFSLPFDSLGQNQGIHEAEGTEGRVALEIRLLCLLCLCGPDSREDRSWSYRKCRLMHAQRPEPFSLKPRIGGSDSALPSRSCSGQGGVEHQRWRP
ncbi:uncharacterized protein LOC143443172 [Arvicanthis niloticus]|uniref:uncharacterized protein LOC143313380 n=1 Tax=Arvicanthis niloticus TaxID=61156 RepID=UPI00402BA11F